MGKDRENNKRYPIAFSPYRRRKERDNIEGGKVRQSEEEHTTATDMVSFEDPGVLFTGSICSPFSHLPSAL